MIDQDCNTVESEVWFPYSRMDCEDMFVPISHHAYVNPKQAGLFRI